MFQVFHSNHAIQTTGTPNWIMKNPDAPGFMPVPQSKATGIATREGGFSLPGHELIDDEGNVRPQAVVMVIDGGTLIDNANTAISVLADNAAPYMPDEKVLELKTFIPEWAEARVYAKNECCTYTAGLYRAAVDTNQPPGGDEWVLLNAEQEEPHE